MVIYRQLKIFLKILFDFGVILDRHNHLPLIWTSVKCLQIKTNNITLGRKMLSNIANIVKSSNLLRYIFSIYIQCYLCDIDSSVILRVDEVMISNC